jgi:hypothetical protein
MPDHRIRLTDRELALARSATQAMIWGLLPAYPELSHQYGLLADRLAHTKAGGYAGAATRAARKRFKLEASGT